MPDALRRGNDEVLIRAEHVSKKFCRSLKRSLWYGAHDVANALMPWKQSAHIEHDSDVSECPLPALRKDEFWALRDVSFEVKRGECLGLIGHNGAGKSTLLKILNSLNRPDTGRITMRGRVGALIELNAGFNPILTGRENIYNQSALLGFSREETDSKLDAIVEFSELEEFLDMPVQNYSSGMKVRLGFAVSSQMEPDILLIDEVLAVGDVGFRFKCLNKMAELQRKCAFIFVSHSMPQVMRIASSVMVMEHGFSKYQGRDLGKGLETYFDLFQTGAQNVTGSGEIEVDSIEVRPRQEPWSTAKEFIAKHGDSISLRMALNTSGGVESAVVQVLFWNHELIPVLDVIDHQKHGFLFSISDNRAEVEVDIESLPLNAGRYQVSVIFTHPDLERVYCQMDNVVQLTVATGSPASGAGCISFGKWRES